LPGIKKGYTQPPLFTHFYKLNQQNGLSGANIRKIVSDPGGFIWIATQDGLNRFDGSRFTIFNAGVSQPSLTTYGSDFHDMVVDNRNNTLWAATSNGALHKIDLITCKIQKTLPLYGDQGDSTPLAIYQLLLKDNLLYAASNNGYIFQVNPEELTITRKINLATLLPGRTPAVAKILEDSAGLLWVFLDTDGIVILDKHWQKVTDYLPATALSPSITGPGIIFNSLCQIMPGLLLLATNQGLLALDLNTRKPVPLAAACSGIPAAIGLQETTGITAANGNIFISNATGLYRLHAASQTFTAIKKAAGYTENSGLNNAYALYISRNCLWLGNPEEVLLLPTREPAFTGYQSSFNGNGIAIRHCHHLLPVSDSIVYTCASDGVYKVNTFRSIIEKLDGSQPYYQLIKCPDGNLLASGEKELVALTRKGTRKARQVYPELSVIKNDFIIASAVYKDSLIFLASQLYRGIYIWNWKAKTIDTLTLHSRQARLKDAEINNLFFDPAGNLGIVCKSLYSVYNFRESKITHHQVYDPVTKAPAALLMDACCINGKYYFAAYGRGIIETWADFRESKVISWQQGITNTGLYKISVLADSAFFVSSNNGLFYYSLSAKKARQITQEDGLHANEFDETSGNRLGNYLYFGGLNGFSRVDVTKLHKNTQPPALWISAVEINNSRHPVQEITDLFIRKVSIPNDYTQVYIYFSGLLFPDFGKVTYAYRIKNLQNEWISNANRNFINLIGVKHGIYELEVQAFNESGVPSTVRRLTLVFLPRWYETWWFKTLVILAVAAFFYWLYLLRIRRLEREQQIRIKLANDLHDDLGSTMNSVKLYTNLALMNGHPEKYLPQIKESTQEAITGIKDILWILDDKKDTLEHLLTRIESFVQPLCDASAINYSQKITDALFDYTLTRNEKRNLYMMLKEAVNNSIKYACAKNICIRIESLKGKLIISVADDGNGFDVSVVPEGNGLKNMHRRSGEIKYVCVVSTGIGTGTTIYFRKS